MSAVRESGALGLFWPRYLQKSVADAPSRGGDDFDVMLGDFKDMKSAPRLQLCSSTR